MRRVSDHPEDEHRYDDLIDYDYQGSVNRRHMDLSARAAQFAPFAALTGYEEQIAETSRLTEHRPVLSEEQIEEINDQLNYLSAHLAEKTKVKIFWFADDARKEGGHLRCSEGTVQRIRRTDGTITVADDTVSFENIQEILMI